MPQKSVRTPYCIVCESPSILDGDLYAMRPHGLWHNLGTSALLMWGVGAVILFSFQNQDCKRLC